MNKFVVAAAVALLSPAAFAAPVAPVHNMAVEICMMGDHTEAECQSMIKGRTAVGISYLQQAAAVANLDNHPAAVKSTVERCAAATGEAESCARSVLTGNPTAERFAPPIQAADANWIGEYGC